MKKIIIIGGGLAGLSSAVYLSEAGYKVTIIESSPKIGGRAYSFTHNNTMIDNGQHVLLGSCKYALDFLKTIGSFSKIIMQDKLAMKIRKKGGIEYSLNAVGNIYPLNLFLGLMKYNALPFSDRCKLLLVLIKLKFTDPKQLETLSVKEWLGKNNDSEESLISFWNLIINATMNTSSEKAAASTFVSLLKEIFFQGNYAASMLIPGTDLTDLFCNNAREFILRNGGTINLSERVNYLKFEKSRLTDVISSKADYHDFDSVVSAIPYYSLRKILTNNPPPIMDQEFNYSPIVTTHIWLQKNPFKEKYYGLINSKMHWLFNHDQYVTTVTSCADDLVDLSSDEISKIAVREIKEFFPELSESSISHMKVIKEKRATFIPDAKTEIRRKKIPVGLGNLYLAGDWTNTGLPGTIEGAIKSGKIVAEQIIKSN